MYLRGCYKFSCLILSFSYRLQDNCDQFWASTREAWMSWSGSSRVQQRWWSDWNIFLMWKGWGRWACSAERGTHQCLPVSEGRVPREWTRLFLAVPSNRTRGNGQKLMHRKLQTLEEFYEIISLLCWEPEQIAQRDCGTSLAENIQVASGQNSATMCSRMTPARAGKLEQTSLCSHPILPTLWF